MSIVNSNRRIVFTVLKVDSIPCSIVGNEMVFTYEGNCLSEPWILKWPMPWIEQEFRKIVLRLEQISMKIQKRVYNPEEPDQYVDVLINSYIDLTISQLADKVSDCYPDNEALINNTGSRRLKYKDFKRLNTNLAKGLISIGVENTSKVAVWAINSTEFVISQFGIIKAGGIFVPLNAYEKQSRMETLLLNSDTHTLIMQVGTKGTENIELLYRVCPELYSSEPGKIKSEKFPNLKNVIVISGDEYPGTFTWNDILEKGENQSDDLLNENQKKIGYNDVAQIIHTSGSTGTPKGVMLSHGNIIENANTMSNLMELTNDDVMCIQSPLFHCFGSIACTVAAVISGTSMVMVDKFKTKITLPLIEKEKCTVLSGVPTLFIALIEQVQNEHYDISSLRTGIIAGSSCSAKVIDDIKNVLGMENIILSYGLTETSPCVSAVRPCDKFLENSVGKPIPGVDVKIQDIISKQDALPGKEGEILVKGYNVMQGYYKMPEETHMAIDSEGWLHTGDIGYFSEDGYLCIKGRLKDIIIRCGENISPKEIEDYLSTHKDISEVHVVGVPDLIKGEEIMAFIRLKENSYLTEEEIRDFCKGKISSYKIPKYFTIVDKFQLSETGKVIKKDLKRLAIEIIESNEIKTCYV